MLGPANLLLLLIVRKWALINRDFMILTTVGVFDAKLPFMTRLANLGVSCGNEIWVTSAVKSIRILQFVHLRWQSYITIFTRHVRLHIIRCFMYIVSLPICKAWFAISFNPDKIVNTHLNCASRIHELNKNSFLDAMSYFPNIPSAKHTIRLTEGNVALNKILYIFITCTNNEKFLTLPLSSPWNVFIKSTAFLIRHERFWKISSSLIWDRRYGIL